MWHPDFIFESNQGIFADTEVNNDEDVIKHITFNLSTSKINIYRIYLQLHSLHI